MAIATPETEAPSGLKALTFENHLTRTAIARRPNFLKEQYKYNFIPGVTRMAEGAPSFEYLPYTKLTFTAFQPEVLPLSLPRIPICATEDVKPTLDVVLPRKGGPTTFNLTTGLAYQDATGPQSLPPFLRAYNQRLGLVPSYSDWNVLVNVGATDGVAKVAEMLLERGDAVLVEEWTFPGSTASILPLGVQLIGIKMDGEGLQPEHLERVLAEWNETSRGAPRPRLLYTIPTGQNPSGATMTGERKKRIYSICVEYDVIILEDDPYYHLHMGEWSRWSGQRASESSCTEGDNDSWVASLPPSFLKYDTEGRVIRVDTFTKTLCPGTRLGWYTCSSFFVERLIRIGEATTSAPSGFSTLVTSSLLDHWGVEGYIRWMRGISAGYKMRRNWLCDAFDAVFALKEWEVEAEFGQGGLEVAGSVSCYDKSASNPSAPLLSFIPPTAGMFVFLCVHFRLHPEYINLSAAIGDAGATKVLAQRFWDKLTANLIIFCSAMPFDAGGEHAIGGVGNAFYRMSFAQPTYEEIGRAITTLKQCIDDFMA